MDFWGWKCPDTVEMRRLMSSLKMFHPNELRSRIVNEKKRSSARGFLKTERKIGGRKRKVSPLPPNFSGEERHKLVIVYEKIRVQNRSRKSR